MPDSIIYIAGRRGPLGSAIVRNLLLRTCAELDPTNQAATSAFFAQEKPDYVVLVAGYGDKLP